MRRMITMCLAAILLPYALTLAWTGQAEAVTRAGKEAPTGEEKVILLDCREGEEERAVPLEEYVIGVAAMEIPADFEPEAIKAQTIIARTYICQLMGEDDSIPESALDLDTLSEGQMENLWGREHFLEYYKKFSDAAQETRGQILTYEGEAIDPLFHRMSAGKTRRGDELHPYLEPADSFTDREAEGYVTVTSYTDQEFCSRLNELSDSPGLEPDTAFENIQIVSSDESGYVEQVQVGQKIFAGDEVQWALDLKSPAFSLEDMEGSVRCVTKGQGHGYGFDQEGANRKAKEGLTAEELLKFYFKNVLISE